MAYFASPSSSKGQLAPVRLRLRVSVAWIGCIPNIADVQRGTTERVFVCPVKHQHKATWMRRTPSGQGRIARRQTTDDLPIYRATTTLRGLAHATRRVQTTHTSDPNQRTMLKVCLEDASVVQAWYTDRLQNTEKEQAIRRSPCTARAYIKWTGPELNRRHLDFQSSALPTELPVRVYLSSQTDQFSVSTGSRQAPTVRPNPITPIVEAGFPGLLIPGTAPTVGLAALREWLVLPVLAD